MQFYLEKQSQKREERMHSQLLLKKEEIAIISLKHLEAIIQDSCFCKLPLKIKNHIIELKEIIYRYSDEAGELQICS